MNTPTTRRHPRTLDEAFRTPRYADPIELPDQRRAWWPAMVLIVVGLLLLAAL